MRRWAEIDNEDRAREEGLAALGNGLRQARLRLGYSQHQVAWLSGVSQATISRLENGKMKALSLRRLAVVVGVVRLSPGFVVAGGPTPPTRRLPGQRRAA